MYIDADTHVDESDATWSYIPASQRDLVPRTLEFSPEERPEFLFAGYHRMWYIDGALAPHRYRSDEKTGTTVETRELVDVAQRLRDMDALGIETQVIYPTVFLHEPSLRPDVMCALFKSYNRWIADRCAESGGRLRFVAMIPYALPSEAIAEMRFAKEHGAAGIFKLGFECGGLGAADPLFYESYRAAADLDLALCIHQGTGWAPVNKFYSSFLLDTNGMFPLIEAFHGLLAARLAKRLPENLRVGFVEAGAAWLSHLLGAGGWRWEGDWSSRERSFSDLNFFVTCETYEDVGYLLDVVGGSDRIVVGTDYTHGDRASVMDAHRRVAERSDLDAATAQRITSENARVLYGL